MSKRGKGEWAGNRMVIGCKVFPHSGPTATVPWTTFLRRIAPPKSLLSPASKPAALPTTNLDFKGFQTNSGYWRLPQADDLPSGPNSKVSLTVVEKFLCENDSFLLCIFASCWLSPAGIIGGKKTNKTSFPLVLQDQIGP